MIFHTRLCIRSHVAASTTRSNGIQSTSSSRFSTFSRTHSCIFLCSYITFTNFCYFSLRSIRIPFVLSLFCHFSLFFPVSFSLIILFSPFFSQSSLFSSHIRDPFVRSVYFLFVRLVLPYFCPRQKLRASIKPDWSFNNGD